jgi:hypothetical protein
VVVKREVWLEAPGCVRDTSGALATATRHESNPIHSDRGTWHVTGAPCGHGVVRQKRARPGGDVMAPTVNGGRRLGLDLGDDPTRSPLEGPGRSLKLATRVRIPLGVPQVGPGQSRHLGEVPAGEWRVARGRAHPLP